MTASLSVGAGTIRAFLRLLPWGWGPLGSATGLGCRAPLRGSDGLLAASCYHHVHVGGVKLLLVLAACLQVCGSYTTARQNQGLELRMVGMPIQFSTFYQPVGPVEHNVQYENYQ